MGGMIRSQWGLFISLLLPILSLTCWVFYKRHISTTGQKVVLPIRGHYYKVPSLTYYLRYQVEYGLEEKEICPLLNMESHLIKKRKGYICLSPKRHLPTPLPKVAQF